VDPCQAESAKSDAEFAQATHSSMLAKQGLPSIDWAGAFGLGQIVKIGFSGGSVASVGWAAALGSAAKGAWFFGKAAAVSTYHAAASNFHLLTPTVAGCPGSLIPDFSSPPE
jgi:hypothetical protein